MYIYSATYTSNFILRERERELNSWRDGRDVGIIHYNVVWLDCVKKVVDNTFIYGRNGEEKDAWREPLDFGFNARKYWQKTREEMGLNIPPVRRADGLYTAEPPTPLTVIHPHAYTHACVCVFVRVCIRLLPRARVHPTVDCARSITYILRSFLRVSAA